MQKNEKKVKETEFKKLIENVYENSEISDVYVAFIRQVILNSYCEN